MYAFLDKMFTFIFELRMAALLVLNQIVWRDYDNKYICFSCSHFSQKIMYVVCACVRACTRVMKQYKQFNFQINFDFSFCWK
jgi:hypothetical protein